MVLALIGVLASIAVAADPGQVKLESMTQKQKDSSDNIIMLSAVEYESATLPDNPPPLITFANS